MYFVYILKSSKDQSLYIGCTSDLKKRIEQHNSGESFHTKKHMPFKLIYIEGFLSKDDAYSRERSLKLHKQGLRRLKERIKSSLLV